MSDDKPEIIPPPQPGVPAKRDDCANLPARQETPGALPNSAISSALTGFQARLQTRALNEVADNIRARTAVQDAETARRESALTLLRTVTKLEEAPEIVALDRAERRAERAAKFAELNLAYDQLDENRNERTHHIAVRNIEREAEIQRAKKLLLEAERETFNSKQGLENQKRLKKLNLRIWRRRKEAVEIDAEVTTAAMRQELNAPAAPVAADNDIRAKAEDELVAAAQRGDPAGVERWQRVLDALDK